jgi:uncharacterized protein (TIGR00255 family)
MCSLHEDFRFAVDLILIILDNILVDFLRFREMNIIIFHNRNEMIKMIKSMTGFGRFEGTAGGRTISVEIKTVNHRFLDFTCKTNRGYGFLEERLKGFISDYIARGKVDVFVGVSEEENTESIVEINHSLAAGYVNALHELAQKYNIREDISVSLLSRYNDVLTVRKPPEDEEQVWLSVKECAEKAVSGLIAMREKEGEKLKDDVLSRCDVILSLVESVEERSPKTVEEYRQKLVLRMQEILNGVEIDEQRILTEAAIFADKTAVAEETIRLRSHIAQMHEMLESDAPIGRKLDFIVQEMNREANTIGSKVSDAELAHVVVDIKGEIEKIREQIQNIE